MSLLEKKYYQAAKVKRVRAHLDEVPEDCGYMKKFRFNVDMNSNGIMGDCIEWCQVNCEGRWGWWFAPVGEIENPKNHWEHQNAYMSFEIVNETLPDSGWPWELRTVGRKGKHNY
jgi:hypothetical protein